jgi:hypothetical protein
MVAVSSGLTLLYITIVVLVNLSWILSLNNYAQVKQEIDQSVDLSGAYTRDQIDKAKLTRLFPIDTGGPGQTAYLIIPVYTDEISKAIRYEEATREQRWFDALQQYRNIEEIAVLTLLTGYTWDTGPRWIAIVGLLGFNIIFDLLVLISIRYTLSMLAAAETPFIHFTSIALIVAITMGAYSSFLVPSIYFMGGFANSYWYIFFVLPFGFLVSIACIVALSLLIYRMIAKPDEDPEGFWVFYLYLSVLVVVLLVIVATWSINALNELLIIGLPAFRFPVGKEAIPYALASCASVPGLLTILVLCMAMVARLTGTATITALEWYLRSVLLTPEAVGIGLLVLPSLLVAGVYKLWEYFIKYHHDGILHWLGLG